MIRVGFPTRLRAVKGEQFWITIVPDGERDDAWGKYEYVGADAPGVELTAPDAPGAYEIRLHGNYPTKTTNVVDRVRIDVR